MRWERDWESLYTLYDYFVVSGWGGWGGWNGREGGYVPVEGDFGTFVGVGHFECIN